MENRYRAVVSEVVATELEPAPAGVRAKWDELLRLNPEFLEITEEVMALSSQYAERAALPAKFYNDLLHIALATVADVDVLVSWNFKHIVRLDKIMVFNGVNLELGYKQLQIYSPRGVELWQLTPSMQLDLCDRFAMSSMKRRRTCRLVS